MASSPQVSILVPTYNRRRLLVETLSSILMQSYTDFEVIVVDNCSTDGTEEEIAKIKDGRIIYIKNEVNVGSVNNYNRALRYARGEFIYFFSDDDIMLDNNLARKVTILKQYSSVGLVHSDMNTINGEGEVGGGHWVAWFPALQKIYQLLVRQPLMKQEKAFELLYKYWNFISMPTVLVRAEVLRQNRLEFNNQLTLLCDWDLWLKMALKADFYYLNEVLVSYRLHSSNDSHNLNPQTYYRELMLVKLGTLNLFNKYDIHERDYVAQVSSMVKRQIKEHGFGETYAQEKIRLFKGYLKRNLPEFAVARLKQKNLSRK